MTGVTTDRSLARPPLWRPVPRVRALARAGWIVAWYLVSLGVVPRHGTPPWRRVAPPSCPAFVGPAPVIRPSAGPDALLVAIRHLLDAREPGPSA